MVWREKSLLLKTFYFHLQTVFFFSYLDTWYYRNSFLFGFLSVKLSLFNFNTLYILFGTVCQNPGFLVERSTVTLARKGGGESGAIRDCSRIMSAGLWGGLN